MAEIIGDKPFVVEATGSIEQIKKEYQEKLAQDNKKCAHVLESLNQLDNIMNANQINSIEDKGKYDFEDEIKKMNEALGISKKE